MMLSQCYCYTCRLDALFYSKVIISSEQFQEKRLFSIKYLQAQQDVYTYAYLSGNMTAYTALRCVNPGSLMKLLMLEIPREDCRNRWVAFRDRQMTSSINLKESSREQNMQIFNRYYESHSSMSTIRQVETKSFIYDYDVSSRNIYSWFSINSEASADKQCLYSSSSV